MSYVLFRKPTYSQATCFMAYYNHNFSGNASILPQK